MPSRRAERSDIQQRIAAGVNQGIDAVQKNINPSTEIKPDAAENKGVSKMEAPEKTESIEIKKPKDIQINSTLFESDLKDLLEYCSYHHITKRAGIRKLVMEGLNKWKSKNQQE